MRRSLALLGVNYGIGLLAYAAFFLFLFKGDPVLAAVPAVFALPGILLQPWFVPFSLLPGGLLLSPILTTVVTVQLYGVLHRKGKLHRIERVLAGRRRTTLAVLITAVFLGLAVGFARYLDFPALWLGVPRTLTYATKDLDLALTKPRYYCLGSFIDSEWLWQTGLSESDLDRLAEKLNLHPLDANRIGAEFRSMPPYWWRPVLSDQTRALATTNFPMEGRGPDGWHALATWDPKNGVLHMWIKDNF